MLTFHILTIFPEIFSSPLEHSIIKKAIDKGLLTFNLVDIRNFSDDKHKSVDDEPYGGGAGMVMKPEPIVAAIRSIESEFGTCHKVLLSPRGSLFNNTKAIELSKNRNIILICGRYEGVDERVHLHYVDSIISIGDYIVTGGEIPALAVIEAVSRFVPDVVGKEESVERDSFSSNMLCYPQYTRPRNFEEHDVPEVLLNGNHKLIEEWRKKEALKTTKKYRPDLLNE
ncbi:MAG: tRNA (guanosine(37)-N1)-methyltransferase TrmD [Nitrospinae bacterium]|nr:tRNA (guanosine(37)-N1)-methyltransferase TrmD [Nitrospinota bacterium]